MPAQPKEPQTHALGVTDPQFFDGTASKAMAAARKQLRKAGVPALSIDAPFAIDTETNKTLPILGVYARTTPDEGDLEQSSILAVVDLASGELHAAPALRTAKGSGKSGGTKGGGSEPAFVVSSFELDVLERLPGLSKTGATHKVYVVHGGLLSNGVSSTLRGPAGSGSSEPPPALAAKGGAHDDSPPVPATHGVALAVPPKAVSEPGGSVLLRGAVRSTGHVARVYLLATSDKSSGPFTFTVDVQLDAGVGHFNIDIVADEGPPKRPAQWHWYAFQGEHATGPASVLLEPGKPW